jgi:hypothetical protein
LYFSLLELGLSLALERRPPEALGIDNLVDMAPPWKLAVPWGLVHLAMPIRVGNLQ